MEINHLSADQVMFQLLHQRTTTERFKLPYSSEETSNMLMAGVKAEVEKRCRKFEYNNFLRNQASQIADWLTNDNSAFGLLLCGKCGNGKTTFVKAFQQLLVILNPKDEGYSIGMKIRDARTISNICKRDYKLWESICWEPMLAIDDLGTEPVEVLDFGNVLSPIVDLLYRRYEQQLFTIVTTNLTPGEIRKRYGDRIADRLNEMMVKVIFENDTYRK